MREATFIDLHRCYEAVMSWHEARINTRNQLQDLVKAKGCGVLSIFFSLSLEAKTALGDDVAHIFYSSFTYLHSYVVVTEFVSGPRSLGPGSGGSGGSITTHISMYWMQQASLRKRTGLGLAQLIPHHHHYFIFNSNPWRLRD